MDTVFTVTVEFFTYFLVRRSVATKGAVTVWRWAIVAKDRRDGTVYVYRPDHWRDTEGEENPFRPFNEFSFVTANLIDPKASGWKVHVSEAKDDGVPCAMCGDPCDPEHCYDGDHRPICERCNDDLFDHSFASQPPISDRWLSEAKR